MQCSCKLKRTLMIEYYYRNDSEAVVSNNLQSGKVLCSDQINQKKPKKKYARYKI